MAMSREQRDEQAKAYGRVVAKAWTDESFKQRLLSDTAAVLNEHGIHVPDGMQVQVHEANDTVAHLVLPPKPEGLSDEQLDQVAGGASGLFGCVIGPRLEGG
jgi:Nitrile hydratase, alpha chain